jgi:RND family efflux transporter MFP subunit
LPGETRPWQSTTVYAKLAGYLTKIAVDKGDHVKKGQIIARVASPETDMQVANLQAALRIAKQTEARYVALVDGGSVSAQEMDAARAARQSAQAALDAELAIQNYEIIRAPYDGVITARYTDGGVLLPAATTSTQSALPLVEIQDQRFIRLVTYVGQAEAPFVKVGDAVHITSRELQNLNIETTVTRISEALDAHTRTMLVEIHLDNRTGLLRPGSYVQVKLDVGVPQGVTVPVDAVFLRGGVSYVAVIEDDQAHYVQVKTGLDDGRNIQILTGLQAGQHVGLHIGDAISDGAKVRIIEPHHHQVPKQE